MAIHESSENYLETILVLSSKLPVVRSVDVANELNFKKSSVSIAMKHLREAHHQKRQEGRCQIQCHSHRRSPNIEGQWSRWT